jgi:hypothetical protein
LPLPLYGAAPRLNYLPAEDIISFKDIVKDVPIDVVNSATRSTVLAGVYSLNEWTTFSRTPSKKQKPDKKQRVPYSTGSMPEKWSKWELLTILPRSAEGERTDDNERVDIRRFHLHCPRLLLAKIQSKSLTKQAEFHSHSRVDLRLRPRRLLYSMYVFVQGLIFCCLFVGIASCTGGHFGSEPLSHQNERLCSWLVLAGILISWDPSARFSKELEACCLSLIFLGL